MFAWAQSTFDKISEAVAPPPEDGAGRYAYAVQRGEEDNAMGCIAEIDPVHTIVNQSKGQYPMHMACQYSLVRLVRLLFSQPGMMVDQADSAGNTPLHYAAMSTSPAGLECVQLLIQQYQANVCTKNYQGQTPYDVATMNSIRQYLLPIQLQAETQAALDNGGQGLPPGIDLGGLRIKNSHMPPPPTSYSGGTPGAPPPAYAAPPMPQFGGAPPPQVGAPPPQAGPPPPATPAQVGIAPPQAGGPPPPATPQDTASNMFGTPTPTSKVAAAPASMPADMNTSQPHGYSRVGGSSAALSGVGKYRADGFHSSSSDVGLQKKYGHSSVQRYVPPPPSSGNSVPSAPSSGGVGGPNPFAGGAASLGAGARYGAPPSRSRYVAYGPTVSAPAASPGYPAAYQAPSAPAMPSNYTTFMPGGGAAQPYGHQQQQDQYNPQAAATSPQPQAQQYQSPPPKSAPQQVASAPVPATPSTPYMPPPPYQMQNYGQQSTPATNYQPGFVSPAAATYGSPGTPGGLGTPSTMSSPDPAFQSPPPVTFGIASANDVFAAPSQAATEAVPAIAQQASADDVFGAPPEHAVAPAPIPTQTQQPAPSANDVFGAPPQNDAAASNDVFAKPNPQETQAGDISAQNGSVAGAQQVAQAPAPVYTGQTATEAPAASNAAGAYPTQTTLQQPSQESSAQALFGASPTANAAISPFAASNHSRTQSAEELFSEAPPPTQHATPDMQAPVEASKQLFTNPAPVATNAADVFAAPPSGGVPTPAVASGGQNASESNKETVADADGDDDGEMVDISLTQSPAIPPRPTAQIANQAVSSQPTVAANPPENSLFAAIGMPPPPLSSKKR